MNPVHTIVYHLRPILTLFSRVRLSYPSGLLPTSFHTVLHYTLPPCTLHARPITSCKICCCSLLNYNKIKCTNTKYTATRNKITTRMQVSVTMIMVTRMQLVSLIWRIHTYKEKEITTIMASQKMAPICT